MPDSEHCHCGSPYPFEACCLPIIARQLPAKSPEQLMRSRYSAYVVGNFQYILDTYSTSQRAALTLNELIESAKDTRWLRLDLVNSENDTVEFKAFYAHDKTAFVLHETSTFVTEDNQWRYDRGDIHADSGQVKWGRNDACLCGSGKKYKKCCAL